MSSEADDGVVVLGNDETTPDGGGDVEWPAVWDACNLSHESGLSPTQIAGAIEVSDATGGATREDQSRLCEDAIRAGVLDIQRSVAHTAEDRHELVVSAFFLPEEVRDD